MNTSSLLSAWVLHYRPYKETSVIADLLTAEAGKVSVVASGARRRTRKGYSSKLIQPFIQLQVNFQGRNELKTLIKADVENVIRLKGKHLFCGLYANELLVRLLHPLVPVEGLWELYHWLIHALSDKNELESLLRLFEKQLLTLLGYEIPLNIDTRGLPIHPKKYYYYSDSGFTESCLHTQVTITFPGSLLLNYASNEIHASMLPALKQLNRLALAPLLGKKPLKSRALFLNPYAEKTTIS